MDPSPAVPPSSLRQRVRRAMSAALPASLFMTAGPAGGGTVALTFDDGPDPAHTPAVLDRLAALGVRATFFVIGRKAEAHPALIERLVREGHTLGHHSFTHGRPEETSAAAAVGEARRTAALLEVITGARPRLYRPPYGKLTPGRLLGLWALGQTVVLWNRDPKDFAAGAVEPIRRFFAEGPVAAGDIVLMHDSHAHAAPALEALVERVSRAGLGFATPADWLGHAVPRAPQGT